MYLPMLNRVLFTVPLIILSWSISATATTVPITPTGALFVANTRLTPNSIKTAVISTKPFTDNGHIARVSLTSSGDTGSVVLASSSLIGTNDKPVTGSVPTATASSPTYLGTVAMLSDQQPSEEQHPAEALETPADSLEPDSLEPDSLEPDSEESDSAEPDSAEPDSAEPDSAEPGNTEPENAEPATTRSVDTPRPYNSATVSKAEETPQYIAYSGVSERFKQYHGNKKLSEMAALFNGKIAHTVYQEPAIVLSDGESKALLTIGLPIHKNISPSFAVNGGKLIFYKQDKSIKGRWIIEVLPETGTTRTTVMIIDGTDVVECQVSVAPVIKTVLSLDEPGWNIFLKQTGTKDVPAHDFNDDGLRDYKDEFIFVANYLIRKAIPVKSAAPLKKPTKVF